MKKFLLLLALFGFAFGEQNTTALYEEASKIINDSQNYSKKGAYKTGLELYEKACDMGHLPSCYEAATLYKEGKTNFSGYEIKKDKQKSLELNNKACDMGYAQSCYDMAQEYTLGNDSKKRDYDKGFKLYNKGCELGYAKSCNGVAYGYRNGWGVDENTQESIKFFTKACELGDGDSCFHLGTVYLGEEEIVKVDEKKAFYYFNKGCELGKDYSCVVIADLYEKGSGVEKNINKAKELYTKRCQNEKFPDFSSCARLGKISFDEKDYTKAKELLMLGLKGGEIWTENYLGQIYEEGLGVEKNLEKASKYFGDFCTKAGEDCKDCCDDYKRVKNAIRIQILSSASNTQKANLYASENNLKMALEVLEKGCEQNDFAACSDLGVYYATSKGVEKNINKALELYLKACDNNDKIACSNIAGLYLNINNNENIKRDLSKAKEFYTKACDLGEGVACRDLGQMEQNMFITNEGQISLDELKSDKNKAKELYNKSCELEDMGGCYLLGLLERENGEIKKALKLQAKACEASLGAACAELEKIYKDYKKELEQNNSENNDYKNALWLEKIGFFYNAILDLKTACKQGVSPACVKIADHYKYFLKDTNKLISMLESTCDNGVASSCSSLGVIYDIGELVPKDNQKARQVLQKGCDAFDAHACWVLGENIEKACLPDDENGCKRVFGLYKKACALGSQQGCKYSSSMEFGLPWMRF